MAWDNTKQFYAHMNGAYVEFGNLEFTTTGLTKEFNTYLNKVNYVNVTPETASADNVNEKYSISRTVSAGTLTCTRSVDPITLKSAPDDVHIGSNNWAGAPIGFAPCAGTIVGIRYYNLATPGDGDPVALINIGMQNMTVLLTENAGSTDGFTIGEEVAQDTTGARGIVVAWDNDAGAMTPALLTVRTLEGIWDGNAVNGVTGVLTPDAHAPIVNDINYYLTDTNAWRTPEALSGIDVREDDITVGAGANELLNATVVKGQMLTLNSTGANGSDPSGAYVEIDIRPTITSGAKFSYQLIGLH